MSRNLAQSERWRERWGHAILPPRLRLKRQSSMPVLEFELDRDHIELNQLLKLTGVCDSGGAGKALVASGAVSVDGIAELRKTCKIRAGQTVQLEDVTIRVINPHH